MGKLQTIAGFEREDKTATRRCYVVRALGLVSPCLISIKLMVAIALMEKSVCNECE